MYQYTPLQDASRDIRLVELLPGNHEDVIKIAIHHVSLMETDKTLKGDLRSSLEELQATLPPNWEVFRNLQGRIIFANKDDDSETSWTHPSPHFDMSNYELAPKENTFEPKYEAISYVWGSDQRSRFVEIFDHSNYQGGTTHCTQNGGVQAAMPEQTMFKLPVTECLWNTLLYLRRPEDSRTVWADAICINQDDDAEKGLQVQRMADIYRLAYRVIVWLGTEDNNSRLALSTIDYLAAQVEFEEHNKFTFCAPGAEEREWFRGKTKLPYDHETSAAIDALLGRPWFRRLWVVQEVHLASKHPGPLIQCGTYNITFSSFQRAIMCLQHKAGAQGVTFKRFKELPQAYNQVCPKLDTIFRSIVSQVSYSKLCRDPRDKIYGILGLSPRRIASRIKPNYRKAFPTSEVYKSTFLTHVELVQRLELLEHCPGPRRKIDNMLSWVPDWATQHSQRNRTRPQFATATSRVHFHHDLENPNTLQVLGARCAIINTLTEALPEASDYLATFHHVKLWQPLELDFASYKPTGEPLKQAYAFTLIFGNVSERRFHYGEERSLSRWVQEGLTSGLFGRLEASVEASFPTSSNKIPSRISEALGNCQGRVFFQTAEGHIGLAPTGTRIGKVIFH